MFKHSIKDNEQFTHTSSKGDLLGFTCCQQPLIEGTYDRVMTAGYQCSHIEGGTDTGAATPNCTFPAQGTTMPVERSYSSQCRYTLSIQGSQLRQVINKIQGGEMVSFMEVIPSGVGIVTG